MRLFGYLLSFFLVLGMPVAAQDFRATAYDDGLACPGGCDAHVVFAGAHNGTRNAFHPDSSRDAPRPCIRGMECRICFTEEDESCTTIVYRGGGPARYTFDISIAYYEENCTRQDLPQQILGQCRSFRSRYEGYARDRVYCLAEPDNPLCSDLLKQAAARKAADKLLYDECLRVGETRFNQTHDRALRRTDACTYEKHGTGGPNSRGTTWRRLLPAACQEGSFVGRDGLDCCDADPISLGALGRECTTYLVRR